jgi:hypothetical protein
MLMLPGDAISGGLLEMACYVFTMAAALISCLLTLR